MSKKKFFNRFILLLAFLISPTVLGKQIPVCKRLEDVHKFANTEAVVLGRLQKYVPSSKGKGKGFMFWDWEVVLEDNKSVPITLDRKILNQTKALKDTFVKIKGYIFYGVIIGSSKGQNVTGYRIDARHIQAMTNPGHDES